MFGPWTSCCIPPDLSFSIFTVRSSLPTRPLGELRGITCCPLQPGFIYQQQTPWAVASAALDHSLNLPFIVWAPIIVQVRIIISDLLTDTQTERLGRFVLFFVSFNASPQIKEVQRLLFQNHRGGKKKVQEKVRDQKRFIFNTCVTRLKICTWLKMLR